jgi:hypothetical protein
VPDLELAATASQALLSAAAAVEAFKGIDTEEASRLADLLDAALSHHASHGDGPCPVCGQGTRTPGGGSARQRKSGGCARAQKTRAQRGISSGRR